MVKVNTHEGLFQYNRLPFGIASAPAIWQRKMDFFLLGITKVAVLTGRYNCSCMGKMKRNTSHYCMEKVLQRLDQRNLPVNKEMCNFFQEIEQNP